MPPTVPDVGIGYVGLPLAVAFSAHTRVIAFDINALRIAELCHGRDYTHSVSSDLLRQKNLTFTADPALLNQAHVVIVAVPTPITKANKPDLRPLISSVKIVGKNIQRGATVVYESTVYPGVTEDICIPLLEKYSGMKCGPDFKIAYSPERINPGDKIHTLTTTTKIVAGMDAETLEAVASLYSLITTVYRAPSIRVAEAAKVVENVQRDLNIGLMNELAIVFSKMHLSLYDVLDAARTKWNFHNYQPGLVGGHCISVDPYYLTYAAERLGYYPEVILSGRRINNYLPKHIVDRVVKELIRKGKIVKNCTVVIFGLTYKEDVNDVRNSKSRDLVRELQSYGIKTLAYDPLLEPAFIEQHFGVPACISLDTLPQVDAIILAVSHAAYRSYPLSTLRKHLSSQPVLFDIKRFYSRVEAENQGITYLTL